VFRVGHNPGPTQTNAACTPAGQAPPAGQVQPLVGPPAAKPANEDIDRFIRKPINPPPPPKKP
jgi:hypothetical protein